MTDFDSSSQGHLKEKKISLRKSDHLRICIEENVSFKKTNGFEKYELTHAALPEIDLPAINTSCTFLGKTFSLPLFIEAMTGGAAESSFINENLSGAAQKCGIGMGLGSQRAMLIDSNLSNTYQVRHTAPTIFLAGNLGASQLKEFDADKIKWAVENVDADAMAIHLNATQELCQPEGETNWRNILMAIEHVCKEVDFPIIVKETGCGLTAAAAKKLEDAGVACLDIGGAGGTSWAKVEHFRGSEHAKLFFEWGIPTADSLAECVEAVNIPIIASGGIRNGMEIVKALSMGATLAGMALPLLKPAVTSMKSVADKINRLKKEMIDTMFLIGAKQIKDVDHTKITARG
jgi:isopentenyl-diphosphate Delta-isomerase